MSARSGALLEAAAEAFAVAGNALSTCADVTADLPRCGSLSEWLRDAATSVRLLEAGAEIGAEVAHGLSPEELRKVAGGPSLRAAHAAFSAGFTIRSAFEHVDDMLKDLR